VRWFLRRTPSATTVTSVFIVDDRAEIRDALTELLTNELDLVVLGSSPGGREAVALAERLRPDVVLMDLAMPTLSGAEAAATILARRPGTRVIALTAAPHGHLAAQARAAGVVACLPKSAPYEEIRKAVRGEG
jgi:DNA-binding NarL/FixJ family response regulator